MEGLCVSYFPLNPLQIILHLYLYKQFYMLTVDLTVDDEPLPLIGHYRLIVALGLSVDMVPARDRTTWSVLTNEDKGKCSGEL